MSANPFDIKTILLARHAQHVVFIHFPIALFTIGVLFDFLAQSTKHRLLGAATLLQFFRRSDGYHAGAIHRPSRLALGTRRTAPQGRPADAFGVWLSIERAA